MGGLVAVIEELRQDHLGVPQAARLLPFQKEAVIATDIALDRGRILGMLAGRTGKSNRSGALAPRCYAGGSPPRSLHGLFHWLYQRYRKQPQSRDGS